MRNFHLFAIILPVVFSSCSNSLDLVTPADPIPVVYFQIDPTDKTFYLTLTRTFPGDGNGYDLARDANQVFYDSANIRLEGWIDQYKVWETYFESSGKSKIPGIFPETPGYCFESLNNGLFNTLTSLRLVIDLPGMAGPVFSRIPVLSEPVKLVPSRFENVINLYPENFILKFSIRADVKYCELVCVFHYQEYEGKWVDHSATFSLRKDFPGNTFIYPDLLFNKVAANIKPVNDTIMRKFISIDLIFQAGDEYFNDYIDTYVNAGNMDLPPKGNINNGFGLFTMVRSVRMESLTLGSQTLDSLSMGEITKKLGFVRW